MQSRKHSIFEVITNYVIGFVVAIMAQTFFLDTRGVEMQAQHQVELVLFMTFVSIVRSYVIRRYFNRKTKEQHNGS